jgi:hypothetical protein
MLVARPMGDTVSVRVPIEPIDDISARNHVCIFLVHIEKVRLVRTEGAVADAVA